MYKLTYLATWRILCLIFPKASVGASFFVDFHNLSRISTRKKRCLRPASVTSLEWETSSETKFGQWEPIICSTLSLAIFLNVRYLSEVAESKTDCRSERSENISTELVTEKRWPYLDWWRMATVAWIELHLSTHVWLLSVAHNLVSSKVELCCPDGLSRYQLKGWFIETDIQAFYTPLFKRLDIWKYTRRKLMISNEYLLEVHIVKIYGLKSQVR